MVDKKIQLSPGWQAYDNRVQALEDEGLTRSDAQGVVDAEDLKKEAALIRKDDVEIEVCITELGDEPSTWKRFSILIDITEDYISHRDHPSLKPSQRCAVNPDGKFSGAEDWLLAQINNTFLADGVVYLASFEEVPDHPTEEELRKYD
jgi:hypothetical protein